MRILFMADVPPDPSSGAAGTELRTAEGLRRLGHEVDEIWASQLGRRIAHGNLHYLIELPRAYRRELLRALSRRRYDVVHVNQPHGYLAAKLLVKSETVFIHRSHGLELRAEEVLRPWHARFDDGRQSLPRRVASRAIASLLARHTYRIARDADGHIVSCSDDAAFLTRRLGVEPDRVGVIAQAASDDFLAQPIQPMTAERLQRVLYVSQYAFFKAPMIVAAAMRAMAERDARLRFTWVCSRDHHGDVRALLGDAAARVELLDWMPQEELIDVYNAHGIFLFGSFFEGFGKVFLEAMIRGLCVVATDVAGAHDIIVSGENGVLVPAGDAGAMADAVTSLLAGPVHAASISAAAAATARTHTWERVARETAAFYESVRKRKTTVLVRRS
jgi:glycosyltransferase involved in cell wall biosynthesis